MSYSTRYGGHIPKALNHSKEPQKNSNDVLLCEFSDYKKYIPPHHRELEPREYIGIGTPLPGYEAFRIYHRASGIIPNYGGHVPGEKLQYGKTFGNSTVDARKWL